MCTYVRMHLCVYEPTHAFMYVCTYACNQEHECVFLSMDAFTYESSHACTYVRTPDYMCVCERAQRRARLARPLRKREFASRRSADRSGERASHCRKKEKKERARTQASTVASRPRKPY